MSRPILAFAFTLSLVSTLHAAAPASAPAPAPVTPKERITLFNGKDLANWSIFLGKTATVPATAPASQPAPDAPKVWSIENGILKLNTTAAGYILTDKAYANYKLHVEWRFPADASSRSNSGILIHVHGDPAIWPACYEAQLQAGNAGQITGMGLDIPDAPMLQNRKRANRLPTTTEKPIGQWNAYDIIVQNDTLTLNINNNPANKVTKLPIQAGNIALQMEGFPIEFQNIYLEPIETPKP